MHNNKGILKFLPTNQNYRTSLYDNSSVAIEMFLFIIWIIHIVNINMYVLHDYT